MVINSTNINKRTTISHLSLLSTNKDHDIWCWKSRSWLGTDTKMWHA